MIGRTLQTVGPPGLAPHMLGRALHTTTPLVESVSAGQRLGCAVVMKLENIQPSGSYKLRGMGHKGTLAVQRGATHFVASSGGNEKQGAETGERVNRTEGLYIVRPNNTF